MPDSSTTIEKSRYNIQKNNHSNTLSIINQQIIHGLNELEFSVQHIDSLSFTVVKNYKNNTSKKIVSIKERFFLFPNKEDIFSCFQLSISPIPKLDYIAGVLRSSIKSLIIFAIFIYIWLNLMIFIQVIYKQYGKNIFKICIMPLISMIVIKLLVTFNIMMFLTTIILYYWGDYFLNTIKLPFLANIIFKVLVPPLAFHHYSALNMYRELIKNV